MAATHNSLRAPARGRGRHASADGAVKADINVTPLVDVVLVLLIIFMVVTPIIAAGHVELPRTAITTAGRRWQGPSSLGHRRQAGIPGRPHALRPEGRDANLVENERRKHPEDGLREGTSGRPMALCGRSGVREEGRIRGLLLAPGRRQEDR